MKNLMFLAVFVIAGIFTGCQDSQVTEPAVNLDKTEVLPSGQVIKLGGAPLMDPISGESEISGAVYCKITELITIADPPLTVESLTKAKIEIIFDAELRVLDISSEYPEWLIYDRSEYRRTFKPDEVIKIRESYQIANRNDVILIVIYNVSLVKGLRIQQMYLEKF